MSLRAVIYCRVSTEEEAQVSALESQIREAEMTVSQQGWILTEQYVDEGRSGTTTRKRDAYNRLLQDMELDCFDVIVAKSQDRLMRNTRDWYSFVDKLVQKGKKLYFYLEHKFYTPEDALITGIKAILAEEYSRELSKKVNNAHRHRQQSGDTVLLTSNTWGYDKVGKSVVINEKEAEVVRLIYDLCLQGYGSRIIARELESRGVRSRSGGRFQEATIRRIIRNPLFQGTAVMNKRHIDFNTKKSLRVPKEEWVSHRCAVPPIVDEETWKRANEQMDRRLTLKKAPGTETGGKEADGNPMLQARGINPGRYDLSGKIVCGECGAVYWRRCRKNRKGEAVVEWSCSEYVCRGRKKSGIVTGENQKCMEMSQKTGSPRKPSEHAGGCDNAHVRESVLARALYQTVGTSFEGEQEQILASVMAILQSVLSEDQVDERWKLQQKKAKLMEKRELLLEKLLEGVVSDDVYRQKDRELQKEIKGIQSEFRAIEKIFGREPSGNQEQQCTGPQKQEQHTDNQEQEQQHIDNQGQEQQHTDNQEQEQQHIDNQEQEQQRADNLRAEAADIIGGVLITRRIIDRITKITVYPSYANVELDGFGKLRMDISSV